MPPVRRYAEGTNVSVESTQGEMRVLLRKWGVTEFGLFEAVERQVVQFSLKGHQYRFDVRYPTAAWADGETTLLPHYSRYDEVVANLRKREWRRRWRARLLWLKATLEFAFGEDDVALTTVLGAFAVLEDGRTLGQALEDSSVPLLTA